MNGIPVEKVEKFIEDANKVADRIYEEGMKFVYHNHSHEFCVLSNGKRMIDMLIEGLDPVKTSFELDTCWVQNAGGNVESLDRKAGRKSGYPASEGYEICDRKGRRRQAQWSQYHD